MIPKTGLAILCDISADQPELPILHPNIRFVERDLPFAETFDLTANEHDSAFDLLENLILVTGFAIFTNDLALVVRVFLVCFLFILLLSGHGTSSVGWVTKIYTRN